MGNLTEAVEKMIAETQPYQHAAQISAIKKSAPNVAEQIFLVGSHHDCEHAYAELTRDPDCIASRATCYFIWLN